ncbi:MAG TPA: CapA family protein [Candidatus Methylomirabilis sp.]|nr:CapA family protein [Candidatus Methylomirabilis sp.]
MFASISLVADLRPVSRCVQQRLSEGDEGLAAMVEELKASDLVIANLETPLSMRGNPVPKFRNLRSDPAVIQDVKALGVHAVTLANNHMLDYGPEALSDTLATCDAAGVARCGAGRDLEEACRPLVLDVRECRVGLLNIATTVPMGFDAGPGKPGLAPLRVDFSLEIDANFMVENPGAMPVVRTWVRAEEQEALCQRVRRLKAEVDLALVSVHWGVPDFWLSPAQGVLAQYQQPLARAMIEAGADVIYGHHSHSLHPIEVYRARPIFYSPGNFFFEFDRPRPYMERKSFIVKAEVGDGLAIELLPLVHDSQGVPSLAFGVEAKAVLDRLVGLSAPFGTKLAIEGDRIYLPLR